MSDFETATLDEGPETSAPSISEDEWNDVRDGISYLTDVEFARQEQVASEAAFEQEQELAELFEYDPESALEAVREQMSAEFDAQLAPIREGLAGWEQERALGAAAQEITDTLTTAGVAEDELESAYEIANDLVSQGIEQAAAAHGLSVDQFWSVAAQNPGLGEALAEFGKSMLGEAARDLKAQTAARGMDELQLAHTFKSRHGLV